MPSGEPPPDSIPNPSDPPIMSPVEPQPILDHEGGDALLRHLQSLWRAQLRFTLMPGAICASPLFFMWLSKWVSVAGVPAVVMAPPALLIAVYFLPTVLLIRRFMPYEPSTLKGGNLLPLPADSLSSWALVLTVHAAMVAVIWGICALEPRLLGGFDQGPWRDLPGSREVPQPERLKRDPGADRPRSARGPGEQHPHRLAPAFVEACPGGRECCCGRLTDAFRLAKLDRFPVTLSSR